MSVLAGDAAVRVVIVLSVAFLVVNVAGGIMVELIEGPLFLETFADDIDSAFF